MTSSVAAKIEFISNDQGGLSVVIDTERLQMRSVQEGDCDNYAALFSDTTVMKRFATGETKPKDEIRSRISDVWVRRWQENDPYSAFAIFLKNTDAFVGHAVLGHGDSPGEAELAGLGNRSYWEQGYRSEAAAAIVQEYAPATVKQGYLLEGKPLKTIVATARPDNTASVRILKNLGMQLIREEERYGALRYVYSLTLG